MSKLQLKFTLCRNFIIIWQLRYYIPKLTKFWYHKSFLCPKIECPQSNCQRVWRVRGGSELKFTLCRNFIIIWQLRHYSKTHKILIPSIIFVFENRVSPIQLSVSMEGGGRFRATLKHSPVKNLFLQIICSWSWPWVMRSISANSRDGHSKELQLLQFLICQAFCM